MPLAYNDPMVQQMNQEFALAHIICPERLMNEYATSTG